MLALGGLVAHQGGWDEALVWLVPLALVGGMVAVAVQANRGKSSGP